MRRASRAAVLILLLGSWAEAGEFYPLYRDPAADARGGTYVATVENESALYLNPAGLAANERYRLNYLVLDTEVSTDALGSLPDMLKIAQNPSGDSINAIMGKDSYTRVSVSPTLTGPGLGLGYIFDGQLALRASNKAMPNVLMGYQTTQGFQLGGAIVLGPGARRGRKAKSELRIGVAGKMLSRRGGYKKIPLETLINLSQPALKAVFGDRHTGYGGDLGVQWHFRPSSRLTLMTGFVATDIGDTYFDAETDKMKMNVSTGVAIRYSLGRLSFTGAYDAQHLLHATDWRKKNHFGLEIGLPLITLYGGLNQVYLTYGAAFDAWIFRISAASYVEEQGSFAFQNPERRYALRLLLKVDL